MSFIIIGAKVRKNSGLTYVLCIRCYSVCNIVGSIDDI